MALLYRFLLEATAQQTDKPGGILGTLYMLLPFVLIIGVMYFVSIRPQKKREKQLKAQLEKMKPGDKVMSIGGIVGRVANISDDEVTIYSGVANTMLTFKKSAISTVVSQSSESEE
ncbi:MAG TPA: preprotein translocase subunit YajC [Bacillota bacterium]|jgi:preprotein translocase subunit YajC|nr:preprotein translocase subunit YajC [Clostridia bacterium]MBP6950308.1 preprotein translocase subunit YajC [Clostridia bacterium]NMA35372.1 preprotein translocase subunit YajC [Clostridiaceae bacterium]HPY64280.1 preprotein translocase subunit YajC [Bacillota bacterium]HQC47997.1 preprotein translocase subunit YajC [Bacillota bacterium]